MSLCARPRIFTIPITQHVKWLHFEPCANKRRVFVSPPPNQPPTLPPPLDSRHTCSAKDRSDYNKAPLSSLPVQREAEVVVLFHATVRRRGHTISYMLDGAT